LVYPLPVPILKRPDQGEGFIERYKELLKMERCLYLGEISDRQYGKIHEKPFVNK